MVARPRIERGSRAYETRCRPPVERKKNGWGGGIRTPCLPVNSRAHEPIVLHPNKKPTDVRSVGLNNANSTSVYVAQTSAMRILLTRRMADLCLFNIRAVYMFHEHLSSVNIKIIDIHISEMVPVDGFEPPVSCF